MKKILIIITIMIVLTGCRKKELKEVVIDTSNAIDRSVVNIMREEKILEKYLPEGVKVKWKDMSSGIARKDALLAGEVQFIAVTSSQFIIYKDSGMPITLINSLSNISTSIYSNNPNIKSIEDLDKAKRIVVNSMTSDDYMLFKRIAYEYFGDYNYFDDKMSFMDEVDILTSLKSSKDIDVAILPYVYAAYADEVKTLTKLYESSVDEPFERYLVTTDKFYNEHPEIVEAFIKAEEEAVKFINENPERASEILAPIYELDKIIIKEFFDKYPPSLSVKGYDETANLLYEMKVIENKPKKLSDMENYKDIVK
jgi:ABC-type nitrate/sulfonate/bicarbonate transport systems, periplasmic components